MMLVDGKYFNMEMNDDVLHCKTEQTQTWTFNETNRPNQGTGPLNTDQSARSRGGIRIFKD